VAEKIRISGGGRCNFTNRDLDQAAPHKHFVGQNPQFCRSALSRYTPADFIALVQKARHPFPREAQGPAVCDRSAEDIIAMLLAECEAGGVDALAALQCQKIAFLASEAHEQALAAIKLIPIGGPCTRAAWWWRRAGCPSPRSAPPTSATGSRSSSAFRWSSAAPAWCR
jgi:predicted flavoprotein YhiN